MGRLAIRCRSRCKIPAAHPARRRDTGRKLYPPAVQRLGADQIGRKPLDENWHALVEAAVVHFKRVIDNRLRFRTDRRRLPEVRAHWRGQA